MISQLYVNMFYRITVTNSHMLTFWLSKEPDQHDTGLLQLVLWHASLVENTISKKANTFLSFFFNIHIHIYLFHFLLATHIPAVTDTNPRFVPKTETQCWIWPFKSKHSQRLLSGSDAWESVFAVWIRPSRLQCVILHVQRNNVITRTHTLTHPRRASSS